MKRIYNKGSFIYYIEKKKKNPFSKCIFENIIQSKYNNLM